MRTPRPWRKGKWGVAYINGHKHCFIPIVNDIPDDGFDGTGIAICIMPEENDTPATRRIVKANAAYIVRAVNVHERLVEALELVLAHVEDMAVPRVNNQCKTYRDKIRAALALAKEER